MAELPTPPDQGQPLGEGQDLTRRGLEAVIRRAVELSLDEQDAKEHVSENELIRIAEELGLSQRHVRQALYERPVEEESDTFLDRNFGRASLAVSRAVPCEQQVAHQRLEDYLITSEYLQLRRRQGGNAYFEPAEDAFSSIARAFSRPSGRFNLSRAQRAYLSVRPLEPGWCHVRLELSFPEQRKRQATSAALLGGTIGLGAAAGMGAIGAVLLGGAPEVVTVIGASTAAVAGFAGTVSAFWFGFKRQFATWRGRTADEADALLDRLEHGDHLQPPASPWLRRLQQKLRLRS